ncbi:hypothetical protein Q4610_00995 [Sphingobium sp. HBC34]|uniref:Uncharacterized protein n=1 Tax=Sphingobium cyanobacteriorum TaxID=3063954 RepID=A0ABT8ZGE7_9SPHN|nr:hypothetical protein [Sphingobium sp. HBC34]MDO7833610.1 hypothetical protein [Sphingobium sp. HBC34]
MIKGPAFMIACFTLVCGTVATAQSGMEAPLGSRIMRPKPADVPDRGRLADADRARLTMHEFADCIVATSSSEALRYRELGYMVPETKKVLTKLAQSECLRAGQLAMPSDLLRGAIFRSYFLREFGNVSPPVDSKEVDFSRFVTDPASASGGQYLLLMSLGSCTVRADTAKAAAYVRSTPGSDGETKALGALKPVLGPCYPAGAQLKMNKSVLSALLAEALYREAEAGRQSSAEVAR